MEWLVSGWQAPVPGLYTLPLERTEKVHSPVSTRRTATRSI